MRTMSGDLWRLTAELSRALNQAQQSTLVWGSVEPGLVGQPTIPMVRFWRSQRNWCPQSDLNRRPTAYKAVALPLSYAGFVKHYFTAEPAQQAPLAPPHPTAPFA
jgi:hypothetical protein